MCLSIQERSCLTSSELSPSLDGKLLFFNLPGEAYFASNLIHLPFCGSDALCTNLLELE